MRKVSLLIAVSLDGYIADVDGKVDWLEGQESAGAESESYGNPHTFGKGNPSI